MRFPPDWIQKLKQTVSLVDVVSENVELKKTGTRFMGCCPFHGDRSPSFSVGKDFYYCFGCKATGDVIKFVMDLHGLSFEEACEDLAEKAELALPQSTSTSQEDRAQAVRRAKIQKAARLNHFVALKYYHQNLIQGSPTGANSPLFQEAREYLKKRGITAQMIQNFQIGVASSVPDGVAKFLEQAKAPLDIAREYGLIRPSQKHVGDYDFFRERLLFPLIDVRGRVCGFGGRILPSCDTKELPKYLNSSESDLFSKSRFLYGMFQAKRAVRESEVAIVVEGYFDVVALHQAGFENAIATCGTSLTEDHLRTLTRVAKKIIVFFDRDNAGITATVKAMEAALKLGIIVYGISFDSKLDPDEFLLNGTIEKPVEKMREMIEKAFPLLDSMIETEMKASEGQVELRTQAIKKITAWLESFTDPVGKSLRVDQLVKKWGVPLSALGNLASQVRPAAQQSNQNPNRPQPTPPGQHGRQSNYPVRPNSSSNPNLNNRPIPSGPPIEVSVQRPPLRKKLNALDRDLVQYFIQFESFGSKFLEARKQLPEKYTLSALFDDTEIKQWVDQIQADPAGFSKLKMAPESLLGDTISQELRSVMLEGLLREPVPGQENQVDSLLKKAVHKIWAQLSQEIRGKMVTAESSQDMKNFEELSKQFLDLQKKLKEFEDSYVTGKTT